MPNHIHIMIDFAKTKKNINKIIGDGKRFMAYSIIQRLEQQNELKLIEKLQKAVTASGSKRGKKHEVCGGIIHLTGSIVKLLIFHIRSLSICIIILVLGR